MSYLFHNYILTYIHTSRLPHGAQADNALPFRFHSSLITQRSGANTQATAPGWRSPHRRLNGLCRAPINHDLCMALCRTPIIVSL